MDAPPESQEPHIWSPPGESERCNFHGRRPAKMRYAGTPLCSDCCARIARLK
jgi:hypothetical protein